MTTKEEIVGTIYTFLIIMGIAFVLALGQLFFDWLGPHSSIGGYL